MATTNDSSSTWAQIEYSVDDTAQGAITWMQVEMTPEASAVAAITWMQIEVKAYVAPAPAAGGILPLVGAGLIAGPGLSGGGADPFCGGYLTTRPLGKK